MNGKRQTDAHIKHMRKKRKTPSRTQKKAYSKRMVKQRQMWKSALVFVKLG